MIPLGRISNRFGVLFLSVCVYVCVKHFGLCLLFSFGGGTLYLQFTPWAHKTSSLSLRWFCFRVDQQHNPQGSCFPEHGAVACLLLCLVFACSAFTEGKSVVCEDQAESKLCFSLRCECVHHGSRAPVVVEAVSC